MSEPRRARRDRVLIIAPARDFQEVRPARSNQRVEVLVPSR
jgi:hypothetical protein